MIRIALDKITCCKADVCQLKVIMKRKELKRNKKKIEMVKLKLIDISRKRKFNEVENLISQIIVFRKIVNKDFN